jgi:adenylate cyclase
VLRYENASVEPRDAGLTLMSDYVVTGILQEAGDRLRVSVQLVRTRDGNAVWGERYDRVRADLLTLQDQIAESIAGALEIQMTAAERERLFRRYTDNAAAYEQYLQGRAQLHRYTPAAVTAAIGAFERALTLDARYAPARAGLALACALMRLRFAPDSETAMWSDRAEREARAALQLDPQLAEAHEALAAVYRAVEFRWEDTLEESRLALTLNPNLEAPHFYRASAFYHLGLFDLVAPELQAGSNANPDNVVDPARTGGLAALYAGRFQEAVRLLEDLQRRGGVTAALGQALYYAGDAPRGEEMLRSLQGTSIESRRAQAALASVLAARDGDDEARALVRTVVDVGVRDHHVAYHLGAAYAQLGDSRSAVKWLTVAARTGLPCYPWYARDPMLDPLRGDPAFQRLLSSLEEAWRVLAARYGTKAGLS